MYTYFFINVIMVFQFIQCVYKRYFNENLGSYVIVGVIATSDS